MTDPINMPDIISWDNETTDILKIIEDAKLKIIQESGIPKHMMPATNQYKENRNDSDDERDPRVQV